VCTIELNLVYTLVLSLLVYFVGQWLVDRVQLLKRFSIPAPVVGGSLVAVALALADAFLGTRVAFTMTLKDTLLQMLSTWSSRPDRPSRPSRSFAASGLASDCRTPGRARTRSPFSWPMASSAPTSAPRASREPTRPSGSSGRARSTRSS
jgi:predicted lipid-binding transport protein (Tim44 family)